EIGTFSGHSALSMAAALPEGGRIDACELDPERAAFGQRYFDRSPLGPRITLHVGPAIETIARLDGDFDLVFIDADKDGYVDYYEAVLPKLAPDGIILADNTLSEAVQPFNEHVMRDDRVECVLVPIRDGVTLIRRRP
ncbi:MAG: O-methyltransferase, partial [Solirubrobacteraceae bacterium]